ncbi:SAM-dependent methyltransferase [Glycomyces tarimensis]
MIEYDEQTLHATVLRPGTFPKAAEYDARWQHENAMGPNPLWLAESLADLMELLPGMRVLDLGCGRAITSIFLAKEYGLRVTAADLWVEPAENWERIKEAGVEDHVFPVRVAAHDLPFARGCFDAVVAVDSYNYFGIEERYSDYLVDFVVPGGQIGVVLPGATAEVVDDPPEHLADVWDRAFHSPEWWRREWGRTGLVDVEHADLMPDGWRHWADWEALPRGEQWVGPCEAMRRALLEDAGRTLGFTRLIARRREAA